VDNVTTKLGNASLGRGKSKSFSVLQKTYTKVPLSDVNLPKRAAPQVMGKQPDCDFELKLRYPLVAITEEDDETVPC
jgi:hypothetical protein